MTMPCRHYGRPRSCCPVCLAADVRLLLKSGRPAMALAVIEELPDLIHDALGLAYARGHDGTVLAQRARARDRKSKVVTSGEVPA
jgi:hypothetical protein